MAKLPQLNHPTILIKIPKIEKEFKFRPLLVKEEKLLLIAKASKDENEIFRTIKQVIMNCALDSKFDINQFPLFVLEFIFIKLRAYSVGDTIEITYRDREDNKNYDFEIDLKKIEILFPEVMNNKIDITDKSGLLMKFPPTSLYDDNVYLNSEGDDAFYRLIIRCIDQIYDEENVYPGSDFKEEELSEFLELLDIKSFDKIREFMANIPSIYYKIEYKNSVGSDRKIELRTLSDFFTLR